GARAFLRRPAAAYSRSRGAAPPSEPRDECHEPSPARRPERRDQAWLRPRPAGRAPARLRPLELAPGPGRGPGRAQARAGRRPPGDPGGESRPGFGRGAPAERRRDFDPSNSPLVRGGVPGAPKPGPADARFRGLLETPADVARPRVTVRVRREGWVSRRAAAR